MYLLEIVSFDHMEAHGAAKFSGIASDGASFLLLERASPKITRISSRLRFQEEYETARIYTGLCYDAGEDCYWACCGQCSDAVFRLNTAFQEVDRLACGDYSPAHGPVLSISWDSACDRLILAYGKRVAALNKRTLREEAELLQDCCVSSHACLPAHQCHCHITRQCADEHLCISREGQLIIHACLPAGYRALAMVETCESCGPVLNILAVRHGSYHFLLRGVLVDCTEGHGHPSQEEDRCHRHSRDPLFSRACPGENREFCLSAAGYGEARCTRQRERRHGRDCAEHRHGCWNHDLHYDGSLEGSCAALIQSVALEQTAISHILNAEGEKIQKVVAVSDRPADFLAVNQSVLELVNKLTHLEQVLLSKLELACSALRRDLT